MWILRRNEACSTQALRFRKSTRQEILSWNGENNKVKLPLFQFHLYYVDRKPNQSSLNYIVFSIYNLVLVFCLFCCCWFWFVVFWGVFLSLFVFRNNSIFVLDNFEVLISITPLKSKIEKYHMLYVVWCSNNSSRSTKKRIVV